jgi:hypothetical protein
MATQAQAAARNAGLLLARARMHAARGRVFVIRVPGVSGPDVYGRYSLFPPFAIWLFPWYIWPGRVPVSARRCWE